MTEHVEHVAAPAGTPAGPVISEKEFPRRTNGPIVPILNNPVPAPPRSLEHYRRRLSEDSEAKAKELQQLHKEGRGS